MKRRNENAQTKGLNKGLIQNVQRKGGSAEEIVYAGMLKARKVGRRQRFIIFATVVYIAIFLLMWHELRRRRYYSTELYVYRTVRVQKCTSVLTI